MRSILKRVLATTVAASTVLGLSTLPAFAAEGESKPDGNVVNISDTNATAETRALFAKLRNTSAGGLRFGQQHATDEHISSTASEGDVYEMTGKYPAVFGWDAGLALRGAEKPGSGSDRETNAKILARKIADADSKGAIVTLSAHWYNPGTGGDFNDTTAVASELLPGGKYSSTFNKELDAIASTAQQAKRSDGTLIPIIFRPLHENNGSWFWWGATHASASEYKELYRYIVDYLRDIKGVHNLIYAYSPGGVFNGDPTDYLATYPGDQWVDVLGYDEYDTDNSSEDSGNWIGTVIKDLKMIRDEAASRGKIVALTEFGRSGDRKFDESGTGDKDTKFFSELADAIAKEVPSVAYMMTWANFGGSGDGFQAYTPWKGSDGERDFKDFADSNANLMASKNNVDYSSAPAAAEQTGTARIVTPVNGNRVTDTKLTVRVKTDGVRYSRLNIDSATVTTDRGQTVKLSYSCNGYFIGTLDLGSVGIALDQSKLTLTPHISTKDGKELAVVNDIVSVKLGAKPEQTVDDVESFDSYDSDAELQAVYSPNNTLKSNLTLVDSPENDGTKAGNFHYDFVSYPSYNGFQRSYTPKQDWSGFSTLNMYLKADGSDHKFVVQINAGGVTFEAYPKIDSAEGHDVTLNFGDADGNGGDFVPASWDTAHAGMKLSQKMLSEVGSFALYVNDNGGNRPKTGDLVLDSIRLDGKRNAYASTQASSDSNEISTQSLDDVANQDPATCPISDDSDNNNNEGNGNHGNNGNSGIPAKPSNRKPSNTMQSDVTHSTTKSVEDTHLSNTGSDIRCAVIAAAALLLGGCAMLIARRHKGIITKR